MREAEGTTGGKARESMAPQSGREIQRQARGGDKSKSARPRPGADDGAREERAEGKTARTWEGTRGEQRGGNQAGQRARGGRKGEGGEGRPQGATRPSTEEAQGRGGGKRNKGGKRTRRRGAERAGRAGKKKKKYGVKEGAKKRAWGEEEARRQ
ncbi:protein argonaute-2-like [Sitophilus oryzae]|uniref:Protein argonaute-2-like n=1 Tax=Sitophilus oryzae TaxID=7048 RepID=A0A6J2Y1G5_SITOR|nr:protein argonaute-2-like [Sitophilus oryzae]